MNFIINKNKKGDIMNKRIKNKKLKRLNIEIINSILELLEESFVIYYVKFGWWWKENSKDYCLFRCRKISDWQFAIRIENTNNKDYVIFGEHEELIDKFRPDRTYVSENNTNDFIIQVNKIKENPKKCFVDSLIYENIEDLSDEEIKEEYKKYFKEKELKYIQIEKDRKFAFNFFEKDLFNKFESIIAVGVKDGNKYGMESYPRYDVITIIDKDKYDKSEILIDCIDRYIKENGSITKSMEHEFILEYASNDLSYIKNCDYKYYRKNKKE